MTFNPHAQIPLRWTGCSPERARLGVIVLHGRTQSPALMDDLVLSQLDLPDVAFVAPTADGNSWYPVSFLEPRGDNEPRLMHALERVMDTSSALGARGIPGERQVILGFSQGACLGVELVYRSGQRFAAVVALTGGLIGPPGVTAWNDQLSLTDMPVLLGGSEDDPFVPASRMRETAEVFARCGAHVDCTFYPGNAHAVPPDQIARTQALLQRLATET